MFLSEWEISIVEAKSLHVYLDTFIESLFMHFLTMSRNDQVATHGYYGQASSSVLWVLLQQGSSVS